MHFLTAYREVSSALGMVKKHRHACTEVGAKCVNLTQLDYTAIYLVTQQVLIFPSVLL